MKLIIISILTLTFLFILPACNNSLSSPEQINFTKGSYTGAFSVTFKSYQNGSAITQSGNIKIQFGDSTYNYTAIANYSSDTTAADSLSDGGRYSLNKDKIKMNDNAWWFVGPGWRNSLYLEDTYNINFMETDITISQNNSFVKWNLNLLFQR